VSSPRPATHRWNVAHQEYTYDSGQTQGGGEGHDAETGWRAEHGRAAHRQWTIQRAVLDRLGIVGAVRPRHGQPLEVRLHTGDGGG
jgi:hypothetical protein